MQWLTDERISLYARAALLAVALPVVLMVLTADGAQSPFGRLGGDFPAFYSAGRLALDGGDLYDPATQAAAQAALFGPGEYLRFPYPPVVALAYAPLALLPYGVAYLVHTTLMGLACLGVALTLKPWLGRLSAHPTAALAVVLCFYPMYRGVTGGQNPAISALLLAGTFRLLHEERPMLAGVCAGLLCMKPQLGIPLLCLLAVARHPRAFTAGLATVAVLAGIGESVAPNREWWASLMNFQAEAQAIDATNSVGLIGVSEALLGSGDLGRGVGIAGALIVAGGLAWVFATPHTPQTRLLACAAGLPLIPPHSLFYDGGMLVIAVLLAPSLRSGALWWGLGLTALLQPMIGVQPLVLALIACWGLAVSTPRRADRS